MIQYGRCKERNVHCLRDTCLPGCIRAKAVISNDPKFWRQSRVVRSFSEISTRENHVQGRIDAFGMKRLRVKGRYYGQLGRTLEWMCFRVEHVVVEGDRLKVAEEQVVVLERLCKPERFQ